MAEARFKASQTVARGVMAKGRSADKASTKRPDRQVVDEAPASDQGEKINAKGAGRPKGPKLKMLSLGLPVDLVERLDAWRFERKIESRTAAIRELLEKGLKP